MKPSRRVLAGLGALALNGMLLAILAAAPAAAINSAPAGRTGAAFTNATLEAVHSGKCMDVALASHADGAKVQQWTCFPGRTNQQWTFTALDNGYYTVQAVHSGMCLDVPVASQADGERVQQWTCVAGRTNQQWRIAQQPTGDFKLVARHSGMCLEVLGGSQADGVTLIQRTCSGRPYQEWRLG